MRNPSTCFMYGHYLHAGVAEREFAPLVGLMSAGDLSSRLGLGLGLGLGLELGLGLRSPLGLRLGLG